MSTLEIVLLSVYAFGAFLVLVLSIHLARTEPDLTSDDVIFMWPVMVLWPVIVVVLCAWLIAPQHRERFVAFAESGEEVQGG